MKAVIIFKCEALSSMRFKLGFDGVNLHHLTLAGAPAAAILGLPAVTPWLTGAARKPPPLRVGPAETGRALPAEPPGEGERPPNASSELHAPPGGGAAADPGECAARDTGAVLGAAAQVESESKI